MRRMGAPIILATTALVLTGCATMNVSSHVLRGADFTQYRIFEWGPADALPTGDPRLDRSILPGSRAGGGREGARG